MHNNYLLDNFIEVPFNKELTFIHYFHESS